MTASPFYNELSRLEGRPVDQIANTGPDTNGLNEDEKRFATALAAVNQRRAVAVQAELEARGEIAALCVEARRAGIEMHKLADWVRVLDPRTGEMRSVTRQAVDAMVAKHEGRVRDSSRSRHHQRRGGQINEEALLNG